MVTATDTTDDAAGEIILGIDTHRDHHHGAILNKHGRVLDDASFPATPAGYAALLAWARGEGTISTACIDSAGSYGAGVTRYLLAQDVSCVQAATVDKATRARRGKTDRIDAIAAARGVLDGTALHHPRDTSGISEAVRFHLSVSQSAKKARTAAMNELKAHVLTAPEPLRTHLKGLTRAALIDAASALRPDPARASEPLHAAKAVIRTLARRYRALSAEITEHDTHLDELVKTAVPTLYAIPGIGPISCAIFLLAATDNPDRFTSDAAFARLCGAAPIPVASGNTYRLRLHRGGNRQANSALHMIIISRLSFDKNTKKYVKERARTGKPKLEAIRSLKRYVARQIFNALKKDLLPPTP